MRERLATIARLGQRSVMDLDAMLTHYFGTTDLDTLDTIAIDDGLERVRIAFGTERETGRRFALWAVLATLRDARAGLREEQRGGAPEAGDCAGDDSGLSGEIDVHGARFR